MSKIAIIAEIGINWNGDLKLLKELVFRAKECGADIAKTQLYSPAKLFSNKEIWVNGRDWYSVIEKTEMSKEQLFRFAEWCKEAEIEAMASAFDLERLGWLEEIGVKRHKVATPMNRDRELVSAMVATGKEVLISCDIYPKSYNSPDTDKFLDDLGLMYNEPVSHSPKWEGIRRRKENAKTLYCVPEYPTVPNRLKMPYFSGGRSIYGYTGFSDHTVGLVASLIAMARDATIIEKHFCLRRDGSNPDMVCSIEPDEMRQLVQYAREFEKVLYGKD